MLNKLIFLLLVTCCLSRLSASAADNPPTGWERGRDLFEQALVTTDSKKKTKLVEEGIAHCRALIAKNPDALEARYYLGLQLGVMAEIKMLSGLRLAREMEAEMVKVREKIPEFDFGGPDRTLGLLYALAPGWTSLGDQAKGRKHLQAALNYAPDFPENQIAWLEALENWKDPKLKEELKKVEESWAKAREKSKGKSWDHEWPAWEARLKKIQGKK